MSETKPKRQMSEEQLAKLAEARKKALAVRQKHSVVRHAEKLEKKKEIDAKYRHILEKDAPPPPPPQEAPAEEPPAKTKTARTPKPKKVLAPASDESSSDSSSDEEYDASPLMAKYKQKYKSKYEAKYTKQQQPLPYGFNPAYNDAVILAKHNLQNKLTNELKRVAMNSLFG